MHPLIRRASISVLLVALPALVAAAPGPIPKGTIEVGPELSYIRSSVSLGDESMGTIQTALVRIGAGYFLSERFEARGAVFYEHTGISPEDAPDTDSHGFGGEAGLAFHIPLEGMIQPYLFADVGATSYGGDGSGDDTALILPALGAGLRIPVGDSGLATVSLAFRRTDNALGISDFTTEDVVARFGISLLRRP